MRVDAVVGMALTVVLGLSACTDLNQGGPPEDAGPEAGGTGGAGSGGTGGGGSGGTGGGGTGGVGGGGSGGSGGLEPDPCDGVSCDPNATCSVVGGEALCECRAPYVGTGETCALDEACASTECSTGQVCVAGTCVPECTVDDNCELGEECLDATDCESTVCTSDECRPSCGPECENASPCVVDADCTSGYCARDDSDALAGICRPACARAGCGTAEACTRASDCSGGVCSGGLCQPACGTACQTGDECATSNNCAGEDICDELGHVCLASCTDASGAFTFETIADFTNVRHCWELDGDVTINANFTTINAEHLPFLREIAGSFTVAFGNLIEITAPRLERIGKGFGTGNNLVQRFFFPELRQVGNFAGGANGGFNVGLSSATEIHAPKLETIYGQLMIQGAPNLTTVRFDALAQINGNLTLSTANMISTLDLGVLNSRFDVNGAITLDDLPAIPWTTFTPFILPLNGNEDVTGVGCNTSSPCNCGNTSCVPAPP